MRLATGAVVTPDDKLWYETYPAWVTPLPEESLGGFLLRLDEANNLDAGRTFRAIRAIPSGPSVLVRPGKLLTGTCFRLNELAMLAGSQPRRSIEGLTVIRLVRWLFPGDVPSGTLGSHRRLRVCPACVSERRFISIFAMFANIGGCVDHGVRYVDVCNCGSHLQFLAGQQAFRCGEFGCDQPYGRLLGANMSPVERAANSRLVAVYRSLIAYAGASPTPLPAAELRRGLRRLLLNLPESERPGLLTRGSANRRPPLAVVTEALCTLNASPADLVAAAALEDSDLPARRGRATGRAAKACPNPVCRQARALWKDGRLRGDQQYVCGGCGTRFTRSLVLFSFDEVPGYPMWRATKNRARLCKLQGEVRRIAEGLRASGQPIVRAEVLRLAKVPTAAAYATARAGLAKIIEDVRAH